MPAFQNREQQNQLEELSEVSYSGPWGGIQSEMPLDRIEQYGLNDIVNMICRKGALSVRPGFTLLPNFPDGNPTLGLFDFFDSSGTRHQIGISNRGLFEWQGGPQMWVAITGPALTGGPTQLFSAAVVNYKFLFSQGVDQIMSYDGLSGTYAVVSPNAPAAKFLVQIDFKLVAMNTLEGGTSFPQRVRWSGPNDPTDWISLNAGVQDLTNNLGPINNGANIFQTGFAFQQFGITQIIPTGQGLKPFTFTPIASNNRGNIMPYSLASEGGEFACYVGNDNIYQFDGTSANPIGGAPFQNRAWLGARRKIFADLKVADPLRVFGYITTSLSGNDFNAYWLHIPGISTWIYNLDEQNWFRATWSNTVLCMGRFVRNSLIRIMDLVGTIASQNWTPATLNSTSPLDGAALGFTNGQGFIDFTNRSEQNWSAQSGQLTFGDLRHDHNNKKVRVVIQDNGQVTFSLSLTGIQYPNPQALLDGNGQPISTNNNQQSQTQQVTMGNGSGQCIARVLDFDIPGQYLIWQISGTPNVMLDLVEICPVFDVGGEQRGG